MKENTDIILFQQLVFQRMDLREKKHTTEVSLMIENIFIVKETMLQ